MSVAKSIRSELGDYSSIVCFKAAITGMEEALGEKATLIAMLAAGRARGKKLAEELGFTGKGLDNLEAAATAMNKALGAEGTRLCIVDKLEQEGDKIRVFCRETICSAGESQGSDRELSYTGGAIQGALEQMLEKRLRGKQIESVLRGGTHDVMEFEPI